MSTLGTLISEECYLIDNVLYCVSFYFSLVFATQQHLLLIEGHDYDYPGSRITTSTLPPLFTNQQLRLLFCQNKTAPRHLSRSLSPLHLFSPETNCLTTKLSLVTKIDHIVLVHSTKLAPLDLPHKKGKTCTSFELPHKKVKV